MGGSGTVALATVAAPDVGGVKMARQALHFEAQRSLSIARRIGRRLGRWLTATDKQREQLTRVVGRDPETGREIREPILGEGGETLMGPILPDEEFRKSWETYERTVRNLLVEQRARAAMTPANGAPPMSDEAFQESIAQLARQAIMEMPRAELEDLLRSRHMAIVAGAANESGGGQRGSGQSAPHETQQGATTPGQGASSAAGNVGESHLGPDLISGAEDPPSDLLDFGGGDDT